MKIIDSDLEDQSFQALKYAILVVCCLGFAGVGPFFFWPPKDIADILMVSVSLVLGIGGTIWCIYDGLVYPHYKNKAITKV